MKLQILSTGRNILGTASALAMLTYAGSAQAAGVTAGTIITSTAEATFTTAGTGGRVQSNAVDVRVDELIDVTVSGATDTPTKFGEQAILSWSITNTGNGSESYKIDIVQSTSDGFDLTEVVIALDSNGNGIYEPGIDQVIPTGGTTPALAADGQLRVFVVGTVPATAAAGTTADINLTATSATAFGTPGTIVTGGGDGGTNAVVGANTATDVDPNTVTVSSATAAVVALVKDRTIANTYGNSQPIPGATITYKITATVTQGTATNLVIKDAIPAGTTYVPSSIKLDDVAQTDADDATDKTTGSPNGGVIVNLGTVPTGASHVIKFDVKIN